MGNIHNINPGIISEWLSLIDPQSSNERDFESKIEAILKSQVDLLLNSEMTEIRAKHWILSKHTEENKTIIEFTLIAYAARSEIPSLTETEFNARKVELLKANLKSAVEKEDYIKAAEIRDLLKNLGENKSEAA